MVACAEAHVLAKSAFPFEGCKQVTTTCPRIGKKPTGCGTAAYDAELLSYDQNNTPKGMTSKICYKIFLTNETECNYNNNFPQNQTRCCNTIFNKFKFWPAQNCGGSFRKFTAKRGGSNTFQTISSSLQNMPAKTVATYQKSGMVALPPGDQWVIKTPEMQWSRADANGAVFCMELGLPCNTMERFAHNGKQVEWLLYDKKLNNYECCVPGITRVVAGPMA